MIPSSDTLAKELIEAAEAAASRPVLARLIGTSAGKMKLSYSEAVGYYTQATYTELQTFHGGWAVSSRQKQP